MLLMSLYELIARKRNGLQLTPTEIKYIIDQYTLDKIPDYQISALLMAIYFQGLNDQETRALTESMLQSGKQINLKQIPGIKVDKHSTGGVGDKVSIILAPIVAAAGVPVPMISGRGLGHTGGTLDKLESIPGFKTDLDIEEFIENIRNHGVCISGQSEKLVPADRKLYALRDVTATIESVPLVVASILSKKLAEGIDALVLDVKTGKGAFMSDRSRAEELAARMIRVGEESGVRTVAFITSMEEPLGYRIGNWIEIEECIQALQNEGPDDLMEVTHCLAGAMIHLGGKADSFESGQRQSRKMITTGKAWKKFLEMVKAQGGDISYLEHPEHYKASPENEKFHAEKDGYIETLDAYQIGMASVLLGAGRQEVKDSIDPRAGIILHKKTGDKVRRGDAIMTLFADNPGKIEAGMGRIQNPVSYTERKPESRPLILNYMDKATVK